MDMTNVAAVQIQATRKALPDITVFLAGSTDRWRVEEWDHFLEMFESQGAKEGFILLLKTCKIQPFL